MPEKTIAVADEVEPDVRIQITLIESGTQLQTLFLGLTPMLVIEPHLDEDENTLTFSARAVDLDAQGLYEVLEVMLEGVKQAIEEGHLGAEEPDVVEGQAV